MSVYDWEDVGGDMADHEAMLEEASEICEERDGNCFGCPIARECPFQTRKEQRMMTDTISKREQAMKDTIYRDEAVEICEKWRQRAKEHHDRDGWYMADILLRFMKEMPSADRPHKVIAQITFDEEKLRESVKEAVERFKEEYEITDRPQGEWIEMYRNGFGNMIYMCSKCNFHATKSNFCPNCGARMI